MAAIDDAGPSEHSTALAAILEVKAFGKDGVRVCWRVDGCGACGAGASGEPAGAAASLLYSPDGVQEWAGFCKVDASEGSGLVVVRSSTSLPHPRDVYWRFDYNGSLSAPAALGRRGGGEASKAGAAAAAEPVPDCVDEEVAFNICQWYGTAIFDGRPREAFDALRVREASFLGHGGLASLSRPWKDSALLVGEEWSREQVRNIAARVVGKVYRLKDLEAFQRRFPFLCSSGADDGPPLPPLPNLILPGLFLGHQGHAVTLDRWRSILGISHVVNLAEDRVPCQAESAAYLRSPSGIALRDTQGEESSFAELASEMVPLIADAIASGGRVFVHCQQGRSRSCGLCAAFLMRSQGMPLKAALGWIAARRPEMEVNVEYVRAMLRWQDGPEAASLEHLLSEHPRWIRTCGVARLHHEVDAVAVGA